MIFTAIFIDSSVFCAYANIKDVHHKKSENVIKSIVSGKYGKPITTDYVFDESMTVAMRNADKETSLNLGNIIMNSEIMFQRIDKQLFQKAWKIFEKTKKLSFTDCTNVAFMQSYGVEKMATFDKGFSEVKGIKIVNE